MMFQRRRFLQLAAGAGLIPVIGSLAQRSALAEGTGALVQKALAAGQDRVVLATGSGSYLEQLKKHFLDPFAEATGISVDVVSGSYSDRIARLKAMSQVNAVEWDVMGMGIDNALTPALSAMFENLESCSTLPSVVANGLDGSCLGAGVLFDYGGGLLAYDERAFPNGGPQNWADFWDIEAFPGPRALPNFGSPWWVLTFALLADGVKREDLFPLDLDRAFAKMEELRPHITVWWTSGNQSQQLFRSQEVVMSMLWNGRASRLREEGLPIRTTWNQAIFDAVVFSVLKDAPRPLAGMALLDFLYTRPQAHANFTSEMHYSTPIEGADELLPPDIREIIGSNPENLSQVVRIDPKWLGLHRDAVTRRWTNWISG